MFVPQLHCARQPRPHLAVIQHMMVCQPASKHLHPTVCTQPQPRHPAPGSQQHFQARPRLLSWGQRQKSLQSIEDKALQPDGGDLGDASPPQTISSAFRRCYLHSSAQRWSPQPACHSRPIITPFTDGKTDFLFFRWELATCMTEYGRTRLFQTLSLLFIAHTGP